METDEQRKSLEARLEWQSRFTMCWNFRWHLTEEGCDCREKDATPLPHPYR